MQRLQELRKRFDPNAVETRPACMNERVDEAGNFHGICPCQIDARTFRKLLARTLLEHYNEIKPGVKTA
jgi:hypothetical protein